MSDRNILLVGGGTGGHIMPLMAVAHEIKARYPQHVRTIYIGDYQDRFFDLARDDPAIDACHKVLAGKLRRFHGLGWRQVLYINRWFLNLRDFFFVVFGYFQSLILMIRLRPAVVFIKGAYVGVPVGWAALTLGIAVVTHDSDAVEGLANRLLGRRVKVRTVGMPTGYYRYERSKMKYVGVPIDASFWHIKNRSKAIVRQELGLDRENIPIVLIMGGSLGAENINQAVLSQLEALTSLAKVILVSGERSYREVEKRTRNTAPGRIEVHNFIKGNMASYVMAADLIVMRSSATMLAEVAAVGKPLILIPNKLLTAAHQIKNAEVYARRHAAWLVDEDELQDHPGILTDKIKTLLGDSKSQTSMIRHQQKLVRQRSSEELADILLETARKSR